MPNLVEIIKETFKAMCWGIFGGVLAVAVILMVAIVWKVLFILAGSLLMGITNEEYGTPFLLLAISAAILIGVLGGILVYVFRDTSVSNEKNSEAKTENKEIEEVK